MPSTQEREAALFALAAEKPVAERAAFLQAVCGADGALRQRLETLLGAHDQPDELLGDAASQPTVRATLKLDLADAPDEAVGQTLGRYKLLERVGEGGCGVVYVAEQTEPVRRRVALKVIKLGMDTKQVVARFEAERQALAMMDHPNIAKVLDAGTTDVGRPYFVMELVRGIRITDYCDQANLTTKERLDLFIKVCQAIQHAHQKGIIHRDIKPSNILVTLHDGVPVPKVIDFGIAKATEGRLTDNTVYTQLHQFIGTPAYMSPEQAEMSGLDIDTRSDIYSLGVLLYELLAGSTPFDAKELMASGIDAMRKTIREKEPVRPSTRLTQALVAAEVTRRTSGGVEASASSRRRLQELVHQLKGDLDWIVMKCLEKDRTHRYETANGLAADIKRHLNNESVVARPPSSVYRFQKLFRRNKLAFAAGGAVALALVVGVIASTLQAVRATRAEHEQSRLRQKSETEAAKATAISDFLQQLLRSANPDALKGSEYTVRQLLDDFSAGMANQLENQPEVEASVRATIGRAYYRLGVADKAQTHHERALTLRRRIFGDQSEPVAESLVDNAWVCFEQQQYAKGEPYVREALGIYRKRGTTGEPVISALWALQKLVSAQERIAEVDAITEEALTIAGKTPGVEFPEVASMLHGLAESKIRQAKYDEGASLALKAVEMHRRLRGAEHLETAWALLSSGTALRGQQKLTEAEVAVREALRIFRKQYSSGHKSVDLAMIELKAVLEARGDPAAVETFYREILAQQRAALGNNSPAVAETLSSLAGNLQSQGRQAEAERSLREAMEIILNLRDQDPARLPSVVRRLAEALKSQGKSPDAERLFEEAIKVARQKLGESDPVLGELLHDYGEFLVQADKLEASADQYTRALPIRRLKQNEDLAWTLRNLGWVLTRASQRPKEAETYLRESLALQHKLHPQEQTKSTGWATVWLGDALYQQHRLPEAEQTYREALSIFSRFGAVGRDDYALVVRSLLEVLKAENKLADGEVLCREILAQQRAAFTNDNPAVAQTLSSLADNLAAQGRQAEAEKALREALRILRQSAGQNPTRSDELTQFGHLLWQLGQMLMDRQQPGEAEQVFLEALQVFDKAARDFPAEPYLRQERAFSHRYLAGVANALGRVDDAERHYRAAIALYAALAAEMPQNTYYATEEAYTIGVLAGLLESAARPEAAAAEFRQASARVEKALAQFPDDSALRSSLAELLRAQGRLAESETLWREELASREKRFGEVHRSVEESLAALAKVLQQEGKLAEAETVWREELALERKLSGAGHPFVDTSLRWLASVQAELTLSLLVQQKFTDAERPARECVIIREKQLPDAWQTFNARSMLGGSLLGQKKYAEAGPLLLSAYEGMKLREDKIPAVGKSRLKETLQRLVQLYEVTGQSEKAVEWRKKLAEFEQAAKAKDGGNLLETKNPSRPDEPIP